MANEENLKNGEKTQFRSGEEAAKNGRKGGIKSGIARRKKFASRKFMAEVLASQVMKTPEMERAMKKLGLDPNTDITVEEMGVLALIKKFMAGDSRVFDQVHEYLSEDPHSIMEEKKLKAQQQAVAAFTKNDGFMEAIGAVVGEVFEDGGDTPDTLDDE